MRLYITTILLSLAFSVQAQQLSQDKFSIGAGTTYSQLNHADIKFADHFGFYVGASVRHKFSDVITTNLNIQYVNRHAKFDGLDFNVNSVSGTFATQIYPMKGKTFLLAGFQVGLISQAKVEREKVSIGKAEFGWVAGLGYDLSDRISIIGRYDYQVNKISFDWSAQLGVDYKF